MKKDKKYSEIEIKITVMHAGESVKRSKHKKSKKSNKFKIINQKGAFGKQ